MDITVMASDESGDVYILAELQFDLAAYAGG